MLGRPSGPVHGGKKRGSDVVRSYEKIPRKMARTEEKEVIHLLPIKDRTGVIPQSVERGTTEIIDPVIVSSGHCGCRLNVTSAASVLSHSKAV